MCVCIDLQVLLAEVAELRERLLSHEGLDQSDSSEGHDDERMEEFGLHISNGTHEPKAEKVCGDT